MKQTMQRRGVLTVAILMMFVLVFAGMFIASMTGSNKSASAADYEYNEGDGAVLNVDGSLTITFEVTDETDAPTIAWVVYLIDPAKFTSLEYRTSHKFEGSESLARHNAAYYFVSNNNTQEGYFSFTIPSDAPAYTHSENEDPVTENDYQNDDTGKTLIEVIAEENWEIGVGPYWRSQWAPKHLAFNIDYYAGNSNAVVAASTYIANAFTFRDYDGTVLAGASKTIVAPSSPTRPGYTFDGWFCDTTKKTYTADQLSALTRNDVCVDGKSTATFYATYKKTGDVSDYLEFTTSVVSVNTDMVDNDGNVGRPYASVENMDYVSVRYDITNNPGIHNLVVLLDYNHDVFTLDYVGDDKITFPETPTALGVPTVEGGNEPNKILWEHNLSVNSTAPAYDDTIVDTEESFFIVKFKINQDNVVSGMDYTFGLVIYPYIAEQSASTVANRIETVNDQNGEQVDVPVTLVAKTFTPVVRQVATITIGGNIDNNPRYYERLYGSQFTTEKVATLPTAYDEEYVDSEDAYIVRYTYDGDATVEDENLHIVWMTYADYSDYITYEEPYTELSAAPSLPGHYVVMISADATLNYYAAGPVYCEVYIQKLVRSITIGNPGHIYSNNPEDLYSSEDTSGIAFSAYIKTQGENPAAVTLDSNTDVGTYDIYYDLSYNENIYYVTVNGSSVEGNGIKSNRTYTVNPKPVAFTIEAQGHTYGNSPAALAYTGAEDGITLTLSIAKNSNAVTLSSTTPVDTYDILYTLSAASNYKLSNYAITVNNNVAGASGDTGANYTVSPKTIYLKAMDQTHKYTGQAVPINTGLNKFFFYTTSACTFIYSTDNLVNFNVDDVKFKYVDANGDPASYSARGDYESVILATYEPATADPNHIIETIRGDLHINGTEADYYYQFFEVFNETYNGQPQTMIQNKVALPYWVTSVAYKANSGSYGASIETPSNADPYIIAADAKTNAGTYVYTIELTLSDATYYDGTTNIVTISHDDNDENKNLTASIAKATITLGAVGGSHTYGVNPTMNYAAPTRGTEYTSSVEPFGDLVVATSINTTLTSTTNAGTYTVTVSATSAGDNFTITYDPEEATYTVNKATPSIELYAVGPFYYNRTLDVTAEVTPNVGDATITYYSDSACQNALSGEPVNAGTYYAKASVIETTNYNSCESEVRQIIIDTVRLSDVDPDSLQYSGGTVTWGSVTTDSGHMDHEPGVDPKALIDPTQVTYYVYSYDMEHEVTTKVATILPGAERTFTAQAETFYYITADVTSNANYTESGNTEAGFTYAVTFDCDHTTHTDYEVTSHSNLPNTMYVFQGESITLPALEALTNEYSFKQWKLGNATYNANASYEVNESVAFNAIWSKNAYKVYLKYFNTLTAYELNLEAGDDIAYSPSALALLGTFAGYEGVNAADYRVAGWKYNNAVVYTISNFNAEEINLGITATENGMVFDAVLEFAIDYYMLEGTAAGAEAYENVEPVTEFVEYNTTIAYRAINQTYTWFKTDCWYTDADRTAKNAPATMPASRVSVYGAYKFDIGYGDVDGNGDVNTDDITLYRKWIVGGYPMTIVEVGDEWETVTDENFEYVAGAFFLKRVADINADNSKDVRDVTITRMAFVGGYDWDIESGIRVTGESIERTKTSYNATALVAGLTAGRARLYNGIITDDAVVIVKESGDIYLDLNGNNLKVGSLTLVTNGYGSTITILNGRIIANEGGNITVSAPNGNIVLNNVETYVKDTQINLQAASSSLHLFNKVEFYDYKNTEITVTESTFEVANEDYTVPAPINVAEGTHVVVELAAQITVDVIKVATITIDTVNENTTVAVDTTDNTKAITMTNNTAAEIEEKVTVGTVTEVVDIIKVTNEAELIAANGKTVSLVANISVSDGNGIVYDQDTTLNLNGYNITFSGWGFEVRNNATFTINGNGNVTAVEAPLYAQYAGKLVINGGNYTSTDNFVIGTHGGSGRGGNIVTVNGGTYNGSSTTEGYVACGIYIANDDTVVINAGTFNITNGVGVLARSGSTTVSGGTFNVTGNGVAGKIGDSRVVLPSGAVLVVDLAANYPGGDPVLTNNTAYDVYTVVGSAEELTAATGNVVLGDNIDCGDSDITYSNDVTLNLNGHNITFSSWGFEVRNGATFTINGNGNVTAAEAPLYAQYAGKLVINGGYYTSTDNFVIGTHGGSGRGGNIVTVNGGTYNGSSTTEGYVACGIYVANNDTVVINGGTFNITNGVGVLSRSGSTTVNAGTFNVTGNGVAGKIGDSRVVLPSGAVLVVDLAAGYPGGDPTLVNETAYAVYTVVGTVAELTSAFANGGNVVLGEDISEIPYIAINADTTLNLNGHALSFNNWGLCVDSELSTPITLTVNGNGTVSAKYCLDVEHGNYLIVNGGTYTAAECCVVSYAGGHVEINGGTFTSIDNSVISTNGTAGLGENEITINGGTFNGGITSAGYIACGIYVANNDTVVVNGGTFNITNGVGILARSGSTTVKNGVVFNMLGENTISGKVGDKNYSIASGNAIVEDKTDPTYPGGQPTVVNQTSYETVVLE